MATYAQLQKQIASLQAQADKLRQQELDQTIADMKERIDALGITPDMLFGRRPAKRAPRSKKPAAPVHITKGTRFKDPETGTVWGGFGARPQWLREVIARGEDVDQFRA